MLRSALLPALLCLCACNRSAEGESGLSISGLTTVSSLASTGSSSSTTRAEDSTASSAAAASSTSGSSGGSSSSTTTTGTVPDLGTMPDFDTGKPAGCKGKIDFLFSISADPTMKTEQDQLKASFKGFIDTIQQDFADFDYHILVANNGGFNFLEGCEGCQAQCPAMIPPEFPCGATFDTCDNTFGAGLTFPNGWNASNKRCALFGGHRYLIKDDPDLLASFTCVATVGTSGANGVVQAALRAVRDDLQVCNDGFLRDDALLVVTLITDSDDYGSENQPPDWTKALLDAKGGDPDASVVLIVMPDNDLPDGVCKPYEVIDLRLRAWSKLLPHVQMSPSCALNYAPFFTKAAALVKEQCETFSPQ